MGEFRLIIIQPFKVSKETRIRIKNKTKQKQLPSFFLMLVTVDKNYLKFVNEAKG